MGCTASKLDNEDTVRRCKERRRFMKEAVYARHNLAAAHNDYFRSLRLTGSALLDFASGEALSISDQTPAILLRNPSSLSSSSFRTNPVPPPAPKQSREQQHPRSVPAFAPSPQPPPPPPSYYSPSPSSPTIASSKLPHILSESSLSSTPKHHNPYNFKSNTTYASTPSQDSSSVWNWENFYPPSPPDSDFFERKADDLHSYHHSEQHHHESDFFERKGNDQHSEPHSEHHHQQKHHHLHRDEEDIETEEREEVQCSDWGDQYSTTSSDTTDDEHNDGGLDRESRSEIGSRSNFGSSVHEETMTTKTKSNLNFRPNSVGRSEKSDDAGSSFTWNRGGGGGGGGGSVHDSASDMRMVVRHRDLVEIAAAIKEYFDQAASAGNSVSDLLELGRAQLDRSFRQLKKHVYHSNSVLSTISSGWTSKPPLAIKYRLDAGSLDELGDSKSHCSTLERLLAWEKKLYEEVKTRVGVNIELEKKLSSLQNQEYKGEDEAKLDKTKASIKRLQSLIVVTSQAASTTSSAILHVRDTELAPQLVELCHGFMYMWRSMNQFHEVQNEIVQQVRGLVNRAAKGSSTSDLHRQATKHLESAVSAWHSSFCLLIKYQRSYVRSLHGWFKLTLLHVNNSDNTDGVKDLSAQSSSLAFFSFLDEWKQALDRLPDTVASEAIKSFVNVVHVISDKQSEEMKIKRRSETASKELDKKASSLRNIEKKFYHSYSMVGVGLPDGGGPDGRDVFDARDPLSEKKLDLAGCKRRVEDEMARHLQAVEVTRAMTLNNIQTGLPGVFQAMAGFSRLFTEALEGVCTRSYSIT